MVITMNRQTDNVAPNGLPPRSGMRRLIRPLVYRHLRGFGVGHIAGGSVQAAAGLVCLAYDADEWAAFFFTFAALNLAGGYWYLTIDAAATAPA
jgi:hypothetical protein